MKTAITIVVIVAFIAGLWLQRRYFQSLAPYDLSHSRQQRRAKSHYHIYYRGRRKW